MLQIEITIPRPRELFLAILAVTGFALWFHSLSSSSAVASVAVSASSQQSSARFHITEEERARIFGNADNLSTVAPLQGGSGGPDESGRSNDLQDAETAARRIRSEQALLNRREDILRFQLNVLHAEGSSADIAEAENRLLSLLQDRTAAEARLHETLMQMWEAQGISALAAVGTTGVASSLAWPVSPGSGLSAVFHDAAYQERFGIPHEAIDIPVNQGSAIHAPADGIVEKVADNGYGYSYLIIRHAGFTTVYGHVSSFLVTEGQRVTSGEVIALSGGRPGSKGAGSLTTGPHLHFEVIVGGKHIDPMTVLPEAT